jgi:hypothetical protein
MSLSGRNGSIALADLGVHRLDPVEHGVLHCPHLTAARRSNPCLQRLFTGIRFFPITRRVSVHLLTERIPLLEGT